MSIKAAFYFDNSRISEVDCRNVKEGNPGIGGTEYLFLLISLLLTERDNGITVTLLNTKQGLVADCLNVRLVKNIYEAYEYADTHGYDFFVFRPSGGETFEDVLPTLQGNTKLIPWCHNFLTYKQLAMYAKSSMVAHIICVGREQMDLYMDLPAYNKSDYIYNCYDINDEIKQKVQNFPFYKRENIVTYIGSIVPAKGFHLLAKAWPEIEKNIPDAQLYVIGSGRLYDRTTTMGTFNIAEASYESSFMPYLTENGTIKKNVHFMGIMGKEKETILLKTKVGVPNPSGNTETFGLTALEFQYFGAKVVTKKCPGYLDTVYDGYLYAKENNIAPLIIKALKERNSAYSDLMEQFAPRFSTHLVLSDWEKFFKEVKRSSHISLHLNDNLINPDFRLKRLKNWIHRINSNWTFCRIFPPVDRIYNIISKLYN